ncbi:MAG TPA: ATP synthase F1 subunit gamma [Candidatus Paceibacterota bacterium]
MDSLQNIKRRIKGIGNINQITKAMELVAATKMRRSQETALSSRPYAFAALDILATLSQLDGVTMPAILEQRPIEKKLVVLVTSDKGLCGSFNSAIIREFERFLKKSGISLKDPSYAFMAIGQKAGQYLERRTGNFAGKFTRVGDYTTLEQIQPVAQKVIAGFLNKEWDEVMVFSTQFRSALKQDVLTRKILPVSFENLKKTAQDIVPETGKFAELAREGGTLINAAEEETKEYIIEPSPEIILNELGAHLVLMEIYHLILEANASEHAARRVAMKNASDNAESLAADLTLVYNKSRQASITKEIIEIVAGAEVT